MEFDYEKKITAQRFLIDTQRAVISKHEKRIEELEKALELIWPFVEEDFPKGTGKNHGTCATDKYVEAANKLEQALKPRT